jgi:hypothetical protein
MIIFQLIMKLRGCHVIEIKNVNRKSSCKLNWMNTNFMNIILMMKIEKISES